MISFPKGLFESTSGIQVKCKGSVFDNKYHFKTLNHYCNRRHIFLKRNEIAEIRECVNMKYVHKRITITACLATTNCVTIENHKILLKTHMLTKVDPIGKRCTNTYCFSSYLERLLLRRTELLFKITDPPSLI